jgi:hypothetical protein
LALRKVVHQSLVVPLRAKQGVKTQPLHAERVGSNGVHWWLRGSDWTWPVRGCCCPRRVLGTVP